MSFPCPSLHSYIVGYTYLPLIAIINSSISHSVWEWQCQNPRTDLGQTLLRCLNVQYCVGVSYIEQETTHLYNNIIKYSTIYDTPFKAC